MRGRSVSALALSDSLLEGFDEGHALYQGTTSVVPQMCPEKIGLQPLGGGSPRIHAWEKSASALALSDSLLEGFDEGHAQIARWKASMKAMLCIRARLQSCRKCAPKRSGFSPWVVGAPAFMRGKERFSAPGKEPTKLCALALV
jgi:hypothetical protein